MLRFLLPSTAPLAARSRAALGPLVAACVALTAVAGCRPEIGDRCVLSTDCSTRGDRLCDTSQPDGYCTVFNCRKNSCPTDSHCVLFNAAVQGCGYDDRSGGYGSRAARTFCVARCDTNADCRGGYVCADPRSAPWNGLILDDDQAARTCMVAEALVDGGADAAIASPGAPAPICAAVAPSADAYDAAAPAVVRDAGADAPPLLVDAGAADASDAAADAEGGI